MTVYEILKDGGEVHFSSGYILIGDPSTGYIDCKINLGGDIYNDGLRALDKDGTALAIKDAKYYEKHNK